MKNNEEWLVKPIFDFYVITHISCQNMYMLRTVIRDYCVECNKQVPKEILFQRDLLNGE